MLGCFSERLIAHVHTARRGIPGVCASELKGGVGRFLHGGEQGPQEATNNG